MPRHSLPCFKCGKPLINVDETSENQPYVGTEFTTLGHYGSTIHDEMNPDEVRLELVLNICDTCILRGIDADVIQSRGEDGHPLLSHHHLDDPARAWVLAQNEKQYGSAWGEDTPQGYETLMRKAGWKGSLDD